MRGAADAAGEDAREAFHRERRGLVVDEQRRGPVAARHDARQIHHQAYAQPGKIFAVDVPVVDADAGPGLAALFGRRMVAEREHARAEHRATARQRHLAFQRPRFGHWFTPASFVFLAQIARTGQWAASAVSTKATPPTINATPIM